MARKLLGYKLTTDLLYLIEALKVEGYWSVKNHECSIQNKNLPFLRHIEYILKSHDIKYCKRIYVKIKLPKPGIVKSNILISDNNGQLKFRIEKSPFDNSEKVAFMIPFLRKNTVKVSIKQKKRYLVIEEGEDEFKLSSGMKCFAYLEVRFWNTKFIRFLEEYVTTKISRKIRDQCGEVYKTIKN